MISMGVHEAIELNIIQYHRITRYGHETETEIIDDDIINSVSPDLADWARQEFGIDVEDYGIEVIDNNG